MARRRNAYYRRSRPRRDYEWARASISAIWTADNSASNPFNLLGDYESVLGADVAGTTVTRIRGQLSVAYLPGSDNPGQQAVPMTWGIRVATEPPSNLTDVQQLDLLDQNYADWMIYEKPHIWPATNGAASAETVISPNLVQFYDVDVKSQRRLSELQQGLYFYGGTTIANGSMKMEGHLNILLKKP